MSQESVSEWLMQLADGDERAAEQIWNRYYARLVAVARRKLRSTGRRVADEEDALISAFDSFCRGARAGKFPRLKDRDDLWQVLLMLTTRKAIDQDRRHHRARRGRGAVRGESVFAQNANDLVQGGIGAVAGKLPSPEFAAMLAEQFRLVLEKLPDPRLRQIALWKMEGYTNEEISRLADCTVRTVARKLRLIRKELTAAS